MKRFAPEAVGINLLKAMEGFGLALEFCKPEQRYKQYASLN